MYDYIFLHIRSEIIVYDYSHTYNHLKLVIINFLVAKDKRKFSDTYVPSQFECETKIILQLLYKTVECVNNFRIL
jgi:hypothetical protein